MLVSDVAKRIDASENTIRNNIVKDEKYYYPGKWVLEDLRHTKNKRSATDSLIHSPLNPKA